MWWFLMRDEPDIVKELRDVEKLGGLWAKTTDNIAEFGVVGETTEDVPDGSVGFVEDEVEKKQEGANINNEKLLWESEEKWRLLLENLPNIVLLVDRDGTIQYINHTVPGLAPEQVIGKNHTEFIPPEYHDMVKETIEQVFQTGNIGDYEIKGAGPKGSVSWYASRIGPIKSDGQVAAVSIITTDITERKKAEKMLQKSESKYRTLLENLPQKIFLKDKSLVYIFCNENYARDLKIKSEEITGKTDYDFYPKELAEKYRVDDKRIMSSGMVEDMEEGYVQDGQKVFVHTVKTPVKDENGNVAGILGIFWDITKQKKAGEESQDAKEKLERKVDELEQYKKVTVGRELKMAELKKRIEELEGKSG